MKTKTPGGKRKGAGRPKGEPTKAIGLRVPVRFHSHIIKVVKDEVRSLILKENI